MGYTVVPAAQRNFTPLREGRAIVRLSDALSAARANVWRYAPGSGGPRHLETVQDEIIVVLEGTATMLLGEPTERVALQAGSVVVVERETPLQVRNESDGELVVLIVGAPPEPGHAEYLPDAG